MPGRDAGAGERQVTQRRQADGAAGYWKRLGRLMRAGSSSDCMQQMVRSDSAGRCRSRPGTVPSDDSEGGGKRRRDDEAS